jgi:hypothetical protein
MAETKRADAQLVDELIELAHQIESVSDRLRDAEVPESVAPFVDGVLYSSRRLLLDMAALLNLKGDDA